MLSNSNESLIHEGCQLIYEHFMDKGYGGVEENLGCF